MYSIPHLWPSVMHTIEGCNVALVRPVECAESCYMSVVMSEIANHQPFKL